MTVQKLVRVWWWGSSVWRSKLYIFHSAWDLAEWLEPLTVNAEDATIPGSIPAFSDTVGS